MQAAVDNYTKAVREFENESDLMSQGFKVAIAANIMPILTDLAEFFRDGFPVVVRIFRYSMAEVTSLFYGLKTVFDIVVENFLGQTQALAMALGGVGAALVKVFRGDFTGAKDAMLAGWQDAQKRLSDIGTNIVEKAAHNRDAMLLAWGMDEKTVASSKKVATGKTWVQPAAPAAKAAAEAKSPYAEYINELDRMLKKVQENEYAAMRLKAQQLAQKEGITGLTAAYQKINAIQRSESQTVVDDYTRKLKSETDQQKAQTDMLGLSVLQQAKLTFAMQKNLDLDNMLSQAKKSGKPLDDAAIKALKDRTASTIALYEAELERRNQIERSAQFGSDKAISDYMDSITNDATKMGNRVTMVFKGMEDALVNFVKTGKLDFSSLADSVISDMIRMSVQQSIMQPLAQGYQTGGWGGMLSAGMSLMGFAGGGDPPVGVPSIVGENGPELFVPKAAGTIIPNGALSGSQSQATPPVVNQYFTVGDVASVSTVRQAVANSERRIAAAIGRNAVYGSGAMA
jgi:lambda family phage tail tape measure protein